MGLLDKAIAWNEGSAGADVVSGDLQSVIADFNRKNPLFHCILLQGAAVPETADMVASYGAVCVGIADTQCLVLLPGGLDMELFAHRLSGSTGSTVLLQTSVPSASIALDMLGSHIYAA
jgi:hypothetical protein